MCCFTCAFILDKKNNGNEVIHIITKQWQFIMTIQSLVREVWATTLKDVQNFEEIDNASNT